ncbi:hypothetical protein MNBD_NITROSPINAE01-926 [hydrothermal vent metagenome]|uniref:16S rRNA (Guanine(527)-N(7))-methyltransferase n=1 Tax=hydrothermal vent metagenome TaxID=652676 RepID=A0A3B1BXU7_9ZZZZ
MTLKVSEEDFLACFGSATYARLKAYTENFIIWNRKFSFTSVPDAEIFTKLVAPSAWLGKELSGEESGRLILDFGCGPGIPGVPMAIANAGNRYLLIDSHGKKIAFVKQAIAKDAFFTQENVKALVLRINPDTELSPADILVSRAAGDMLEIVSLFRGKMKKGASAYFFKGGDADEEVMALLKRFPSAKIDVLSTPAWFEDLKIVRIFECFT